MLMTSQTIAQTICNDIYNKKVIGNKWDCWSICILIVTFHEFAINYKLQLRSQLAFQVFLPNIILDRT